MQQIKEEYTIVIVTHNMQQAARVSDRTAFFIAEVSEAAAGSGRRPAHRPPGGVRHHRDDLLQPRRRTDRELHHRPLRLTCRRPT